MTELMTALLLERQSGMPRWNTNRYTPDGTVAEWNDTPEQCAARRAVLAETATLRVAA